VNDSGFIHDPLQPADLCLLEPAGGPCLELVAGPVVEGTLKRNSSYYHLCYSVDDIDGTIDEASQSGCLLVSSPKPAVLFGGRRVSFMLGPTGLIEFLEDS
jgi:methylmalonyl-CoA/ethylmalonyl-CoA epimerase